MAFGQKASTDRFLGSVGKDKVCKILTSRRYWGLMPNRTALLICCSVVEAARIRNKAGLERRTVGNYVLNIVMRAVVLEGNLVTALSASRQSNRSRSVRIQPPRPRTAMLLRCSIIEARKIRSAAKRQQMSLSGFVLHCIRRSWDIRRFSVGDNF